MRFKMVFLIPIVMLLIQAYADEKTPSLQKSDGQSHLESPRIFQVSAHESITTCSGKTYERCKIIKTNPHEIIIRHSSGVARIPFDELPKEEWIKFGYQTTSLSEWETIQESEFGEQLWLALWNDVSDNQDSLKPDQLFTPKGFFSVYLILDDRNVLVNMPVKEKGIDIKGKEHFSFDVELVCLRGISTSELYWRKKLMTTLIFKVTEITTFQTLLGDMTVFVLEPARSPK